MKFHDSFFSIAPKAFKPINVHFASRESFLMVDLQMSIATKHKGIITPEFIRVYNRASSYGFNRHRQKRFSCNILNHFNQNSAVSLENSEYWNLVISSPSSFAFTSSTKITFIQFYLAVQKILRLLGIGYNSNPDNCNSLQNRWIAQLNLLCYLPGRHLKFKQFYNPKPLFIRYLDLIKPSASKVMKLISTAFTPVSFIRNSIGLIAPTRYAKTLRFFQQFFLK